MISRDNLEQQLKRIRFNSRGWGRSEAGELCDILMPDEEIDECVNGYYEAGFAMLVATKDRIVLVDKKPLNYLSVEDMRFDTINEFDYSHRLIGAEVKISAGMKTLHFTSWNQERLRRLLGFVQYRMTEVKKIQQTHQADQKAHLEHLDRQLQLFLAIQQYQYQQFTTQLTPDKMTPQATPATTLMGLAGSSVPRAQMPQLSAGQVSIAAMKRVLPVISAYTRLPWMSQYRRLQGSVM
jgi:hypothetical protein